MTDHAVIEQIDSGTRQISAPLHDIVPAATRRGRQLRTRRRAMWSGAVGVGVAAAVGAALAVVPGQLSGADRLEPTAPDTSQHPSFVPVPNGGLTHGEVLDVLAGVAPELNVETWRPDRTGVIKIDDPDKDGSWVFVNGSSDNDGINGFDFMATYPLDRFPGFDKCSRGEEGSTQTACKVRTLEDGSTLVLQSGESGNGFLENTAKLIRPDGVTIYLTSQNYRAPIDGVELDMPTAPTREQPLYSLDQLAKIITAPEWSEALHS